LDSENYKYEKCCNYSAIVHLYSLMEEIRSIDEAISGDCHTPSELAMTCPTKYLRNKAEYLEKYTHLIEKSKKRQEEKEISGRASKSVNTDDNESYYKLLDHLARRREKKDNIK